MKEEPRSTGALSIASGTSSPVVGRVAEYVLVWVGATALFIVCSGKTTLRGVSHTLDHGGGCMSQRQDTSDSECQGPGEGGLEGSCEAGA